MPADLLAALTATNSAALHRLRAGLSNDCVISVELGPGYLGSQSPHLTAFKNMAYLMRAEGWQAEKESRTNDAARIYLATMQFGQKSSRGGVMIDRLVGIAAENIGFYALLKFTNSLPAKDCREVARALEKFDAESESAEQVLANEALWVRRAIPLRERAFEGVRQIFSGQTKATKANFENKMAGQQRAIRQTMVIFASRAYQLEKGFSPKSASALVPEYLQAVPQDLSTGQKLALP